MTAIRALSVAALLLMPGALAAQSMAEGYDMLTAALVNDFERLGIDIPPNMDSLTLGQIAIIRSIVDSDESEGQQRGRIEAIIANN